MNDDPTDDLIGDHGEYEGDVEFRLINIDEDEDGAALMARFGAQYVPTFVFVTSDGATVGQLVGEVEIYVPLAGLINFGEVLAAR